MSHNLKGNKSKITFKFLFVDASQDKIKNNLILYGIVKIKLL